MTRHLSGFLPPGARPEDPRRAAPAAARHAGLEVPRDAACPILCCGSAGIYNVVQNEMAMAMLDKKMAERQLHGSAGDRDRQSRLHAATASRGAAARTRPARGARGGDAGRSVQELCKRPWRLNKPFSQDCAIHTARPSWDRCARRGVRECIRRAEPPAPERWSQR